jgi:hypothetical protein
VLAGTEAVGAGETILNEPQHLFVEPDDVCHVHLHWEASQGWSVWVNSWVGVDGPRTGRSAGYDRLTLVEALQTVEDDVRARVWGQAEQPLR